MSQIKPQSARPPFDVALAVCTLFTVLMIVLRLWILQHHFVPLADSVPMLICLWARYRRLLWGMAITFTATTAIKIFFIHAQLPGESGGSIGATAAMMTANIWVTAGVLHSLLSARERLEQRNQAIEHANTALAEVNDELTTRDEEIQRQNEELQSQTEELEQQAEELVRTSATLQELNEELVRREKALERLLASSRWLRTDMDQQAVVSRICEAALEVLEGDAHAIAIVEKRDDHLHLRGCAGLGAAGPARQQWPYDRSFAAIVMEENRTGFLADIALCPGIEVLQPLQGPPFQSLLATPLKISGATTGAVVVYSRAPRQWCEKTFKVVEWLAAQIALVVEAIDLQVQLHQRRLQAEEASQRKTRFLAAVSHDVRTPANAINLMAELISRAARSGIPSTEIADMARDLQSSARLLVELVSDVLDLARFDSAALDLQPQSFQLWPVIHAEVKQLLPLAQEQNLHLQAQLSGEAIWLRTDRMKLARVLGNLIGNAIKFTATGGVKVHGAVLSDGSVEIKVIDTGIGIPAEHLNDIFDEFVQLRNPARDRSKGTGLGLAICKRLVTTLGCTLSVESTPGEGATFTVRIPHTLRVTPPAVKPLDPSRAHHGRLAGLRILLVEDHEMTRRATAKVLASEGATVIQAEHGRAALQILAHDFPQVLLLDLMLPDIDGSEILRKLRTQRPASLKCMLAVSGDVSPARIDEVKALGAQDLIPKPVDIDHLVNTINANIPASTKAIAQLT
ncbi:MAG TPA: ATP-binding protein [Tepidisphaeraceae bacterium]|jgi:signal transduction histidine kinase/ActR/RegA family two-component response regulator